MRRHWLALCRLIDCCCGDGSGAHERCRGSGWRGVGRRRPQRVSGPDTEDSEAGSGEAARDRGLLAPLLLLLLLVALRA